MNVLCAVIYAFAVSLSENTSALLAASVLPVICLCVRRPDLHRLLKLNVINAVMILTMTLTWPVMLQGLRLGLVIAFRVNMIYVVFAALVFPLGFGAVYDLPLPYKLRVLLLLTLRGIYVLKDSLDSALISASLRAPSAGLVMRLKIFAYIVGSSLLRSSDRSERMRLAVENRGGFGGFMQAEKVPVNMRNVMLLVLCGGYSAMIAVMNYA